MIEGCWACQIGDFIQEPTATIVAAATTGRTAATTGRTAATTAAVAATAATIGRLYHCR